MSTATCPSLSLKSNVSTADKCCAAGESGLSVDHRKRQRRKEERQPSFLRHAVSHGCFPVCGDCNFRDAVKATSGFIGRVHSASKVSRHAVGDDVEDITVYVYRRRKDTEVSFGTSTHRPSNLSKEAVEQIPSLHLSYRMIHGVWALRDFLELPGRFGRIGNARPRFGLYVQRGVYNEKALGFCRPSLALYAIFLWISIMRSFLPGNRGTIGDPKDSALYIICHLMWKYISLKLTPLSNRKEPRKSQGHKDCNGSSPAVPLCKWGSLLDWYNFGRVSGPVPYLDDGKCPNGVSVSRTVSRVPTTRSIGTH
ncbi:hypothetical protein BV25DRAFT_1843273 [Artomyces pyxidatus]|uniref:Uncharacterized protein n=1 Tax=Artomyces pyxidatus TaxID=48021 RepID=A0ACB8SF72_9AGAM|nr:hypothetical protein BV25DRAFT_1843273 [Artomyces pyxidatus]